MFTCIYVSIYKNVKPISARRFSRKLTLKNENNF